jgi:hypothetical protein
MSQIYLHQWNPQTLSAGHSYVPHHVCLCVCLSICMSQIHLYRGNPQIFVCWALLHASSCLSVCASRHTYITNPSTPREFPNLCMLGTPTSRESPNLCMLGTPTSRESPNLCMLGTPTSREFPNLCTLAYYQIEI